MGVSHRLWDVHEIEAVDLAGAFVFGRVGVLGFLFWEEGSVNWVSAFFGWFKKLWEEGGGDCVIK